MYSYEDRIRAVELYIRLGKRVAATIHRLGYPNRNSLRGWHREYERQLDLARSYPKRQPKYSQAQKMAAVQHYIDHGRCLSATIRALGYPGRTYLRAWIVELHPGVRVVSRADRTRRPPEAKQEAVIALCTRQGSADALAQEFGISRPTLYNWKNQLLGCEVLEQPPLKPDTV